MIKAEKTYYLGQFMGGAFSTGRRPKGFAEEVWPDIIVMRDKDGVICVVEYLWEEGEPLAAWLLGLKPRRYISYPKNVRPGISTVRVTQEIGERG